MASDLEPVATADQVRKARSQLNQLATDLELSDLRVTSDGTPTL